MNAIVSASVGRAILLDGERIFSIEPDATGALVPRTPRDVPFLLGEARDLDILEGVTVDQVRARLEETLRHDDALRWTLSLLDGDLRATTRTTLAEAAEPLLGETGTRDFVESVLCAQPIPEDLDPVGAEKIAADAGCRTIVGMLRDLQARQAIVRTVHAAWEALPTKVFGSHEDRVRARAAVVREGLFRKLVAAVATGESSDAILAAALAAPRIRSLPRSRDFLLKWTSQLATSAARRVLEVEQIETYVETTEEPQSQRGSAPQRMPGHLAKQRVDESQTGIRASLARGDVDRARSMMRDLVAFQIKSGSPLFAVKSLCNMAAEAQRRGIRSLQDEWTVEAVRIGPADGWAWAQRGKALLDLMLLDEALDAYSKADAFGGGVVAKNGRAEVLKAMGRFDDALRLYDEAANLHPEDVVAKTGRAEVLKAMGRFDDALRAYDEAANLHPEDVFAKTGRAEVLKAMGRFDDALRLYDEAANLHPEDVVAKNGRAEVLKAMGRFDDALRVYDEAANLHPEDVVAKTGRAEVLKAMGRFDDALRAYDEAANLHPEDVFAKNGRAEVLKAMGRFDDALRVYDEAANLHPENVVAKTGRAEVLKAMGRFEDALGLYDEAANLHPENVVAKNGRAEVLKAMGRFEDALRAYDEAANLHPENVVARTGRACVLALLGKSKEALRALPKTNTGTRDHWVVQHVRGMILLRTGKAAEAVLLFEEGARDCLHDKQRAYFRSALAVARLRQREYAAAAEVLSHIELSHFSDVARLLQVHALGELKQFDRAAEVAKSIAPTLPALLEKIRREVSVRYLTRTGAQNTDEELIKAEIQGCLIAA